jgi:DnaJ like chaperone protein
MEKHPNSFTFIIVAVAFIVGYLLVSFIIKRIKELHNRPKFNEKKSHEQERDKEQKDYSNWRRTEGSQSYEEKDKEKRKNTSGYGTTKDEKYYLSILGLKSYNTSADIKFRYKELAMQYHPDKAAHLGPKLRETAEKEMKKINEAYDFFKRKYGFS